MQQPAVKPKTVMAAQALLWLQFIAITSLYTIGLGFVFAATTSDSSHDTMGDVLLSIDLERWVLILVSIGITAAMPVIAQRLGRRDDSAIVVAWYALAYIPFAMYLWIALRAYLATFPDDAPFFLSAAAMLVVCGAFPASILGCLSSKSAKAWFATRVPVAIPEPAEERELVGAGMPR
ncbi:hypothetical protein [Glycomyces buryatensis]|uniref:DUF2569 domain-containing protein n=1 Tax=Glycomyces buryatensis TaxID=2570927 RepID=A0A4S8QCS8_9ACTN|nr:hypothetical protein [Glycomyces buryatensis]THV40832.1 hypothetical protein FAB82_14400 [Glycomyces buryatensis]